MKDDIRSDGLVIVDRKTGCTVGLDMRDDDFKLEPFQLFERFLLASIWQLKAARMDLRERGKRTET